MTRELPLPPPRDLRTLAAQLQVASEAAADTIDYALSGGCSNGWASARANAVVQRARQFRRSVEQKVPISQLRQDFESVAGAFIALARPLQQQSESFLVDRAMVRVDRLLAAIGHTIAPPGPQSIAPSETDGAQPLELTRPENALRPDGGTPSVPHAHPHTAAPDSPEPLPQPNSPDADAQPSVPRPLIPGDMKGIALLPLEDQAAALAQKTCPVTGGKLGAMGKPIKVDLGGRFVFVCCPGCVEEVKKKARS